MVFCTQEPRALTYAERVGKSRGTASLPFCRALYSSRRLAISVKLGELFCCQHHVVSPGVRGMSGGALEGGYSRAGGADLQGRKAGLIKGSAQQLDEVMAGVFAVLANEAFSPVFVPIANGSSDGLMFIPDRFAHG